MAPLPSVPGVVKASIGWKVGNNTTAETILHFAYTGGPPSTTDCIALSADLEGYAATSFKPLMATTCAVISGTILDLASATGAEGTTATTNVGTRTGSFLSASTSVVMNHQIARRYRGGKPRSYCPFGVSADMSTTGTWLGSFLTSVDTAWSTFITNMLASTSGSTVLTHQVNVSYYHAGSVRPTPVVDNISLSLARTKIGSQRRRLKTA